jgi:hypothetical protein
VVGCRPIAAIVLGLAILAWLPLTSSPAVRAETPVETRISPPSTLKPRMPQRRPAAEPPEEEEQPNPAATQARPADTDEEPDGEDIGADDRPATPAAAGDGDVRTHTEAQVPLDGVIEVGEPLPVPDGIPDMRKDFRTPREIAAFDGPPAGYNPYLFQIELDPLTDRRTVELFWLEPYAARGIRIGSFVLFPEVEVGTIATSNIFRSPIRRSDSALEVRPTVRLVSDWRTHAVEVRGTGLASFYQEFPSEDDRAYTLEGRGRVVLTGRTNIEVLASHRRDKDLRSNHDSPIGAAERGDIEINRFAFAFNHRFNRLSLQLRGSVTDFDFAPVPMIGGGIISNDERDFTQRDAAIRASWAANQKVELFVETASNDREFHVAPADGILRSSRGERYRVGVGFRPWDATVRGEVSVGWGGQSPDDARLGEIEGFIIDANLAWRATPLTTLLLTASSDFIDTTATGSGGALSHQIGLEARHAFRRHLIGVAGIKYTATPYEGIDLTERTLTSELGFDCYLSRDVILYGRYQHLDFESTVPASDYAADVVRFGVRVRQ